MCRRQATFRKYIRARTFLRDALSCVMHARAQRSRENTLTLFPEDCLSNMNDGKLLAPRATRRERPGAATRRRGRRYWPSGLAARLYLP